jgi:hypothetical protein
LHKKFNQKIEILGGTNRNLETKSLTNQIKASMKNINSRLDQAEERISGTEDKVEELLHLDSNKFKNK